MASYALVIAVTAFLAGAATAVFVMLVIGIRKADRPRRGPDARNTPLDAATRSMLRANTWPNNPVVHGDREQR
jgi:hypothetical protein